MWEVEEAEKEVKGEEGEPKEGNKKEREEISTVSRSEYKWR